MPRASHHSTTATGRARFTSAALVPARFQCLDDAWRSGPDLVHPGRPSSTDTARRPHIVRARGTLWRDERLTLPAAGERSFGTRRNGYRPARQFIRGLPDRSG